MEIKTQHFDYTYLPAVNFGQTSAQKIMVVMHGLGDSKTSYIDFCKELNVSGLQYLIINGPIDYYGGYAWYEPPPEPPQQSLIDSLEKLENLMEELLKQGFENEDIFVLGFSQGGCMSLEHLYRRKEKLGGVVALSPKMYPIKESLSPNKNQVETPLFVTHGLYDDLIPYSEVEKGCLELRERGFKPIHKSYPIGHEIDFDEIEDLRNWINEYL